jgi:hypothetical protein
MPALSMLTQAIQRVPIVSIAHVPGLNFQPYGPEQAATAMELARRLQPSAPRANLTPLPTATGSLPPRDQAGPAP